MQSCHNSPHESLDFITLSILFVIAYAAAPTSPGIPCNLTAFAINVCSFNIYNVYFIVLTESPVMVYSFSYVFQRFLRPVLPSTCSKLQYNVAGELLIDGHRRSSRLVVVHHINGQRMEKYYLIGSTLLCLALNVPPLALDQFGWNQAYSTCWYKASNMTTRLHWMIATESCPLALAATIETVCSCILLVYMYLVRVG